MRGNSRASDTREAEIFVKGSTYPLSREGYEVIHEENIMRSFVEVIQSTGGCKGPFAISGDSGSGIYAVTDDSRNGDRLINTRNCCSEKIHSNERNSKYMQNYILRPLTPSVLTTRGSSSTARPTYQISDRWPRHRLVPI